MSWKDIHNLDWIHDFSFMILCERNAVLIFQLICSPYEKDSHKCLKKFWTIAILSVNLNFWKSKCDAYFRANFEFTKSHAINTLKKQNILFSLNFCS